MPCFVLAMLSLFAAAPVHADLYGTTPGLPGEVLAQLHAPDPARRRQGIEQLEGLFGPGTQGTVEEKQALPLLLERLSDSDALVRVRAAQALGRRQVLGAASALIDRLSDPDSGVRIASADALGLFGALPQGLSRKAALALSRALSDAQFEVRLSMLHALDHLLRISAFLPGDLTPLLGPVLLHVDDDNVGVRRAAVAVLGRAGPLLATMNAGDGKDPSSRLLVPLIGRLSDSARDVRAEALSSLAALSAKSAVPAVLRLLRDPTEEVRRQAVLCLGQLHATAALPLLGPMLEEGSEPVRTAVATSLSQIAQKHPDAGQQAVQALLRGLRREDLLPVAREALHALGAAVVPALSQRLSAQPESGPPPGQAETAALVRLLGEAGSHADPQVRAQAGKALLQELSRGRLPREQVIDALGSLGDPETAAVCTGLLLSPDVTVRRHAILALRRPGLLDARALSALLGATSDGDRQVRTQAILALSDLGHAASLPRLIELLHSDDPETRAAAAQALPQITVSIAAPSLRPVAMALVQRVATYHPGDAERTSRRAAAEALGRLVARSPALGATVVPALTAPLRRPPGKGALQDDGLPEVIAALSGVLRGRSGDAASAIGRETLLELAESPADAHTREAALALDALSALGALRDGQSASRLQRLLSNRDPLRRLRAAFALGCLLAEGAEDRPASALLSVLSGEPDAWVRAEAAWALSRLRPASPLLHRVTTGLRQALLRVRFLADEGETAQRANLVAALAVLGQADPADAELLTDRDPGVRTNAALLLSTLTPRSEGLRARLQDLQQGDEDHRVRHGAALALADKAQVGPRTAPLRRHFLGLYFMDYDRHPLAEVRYRLSTPEGLVRVGTADGRGLARDELLLPGRCEFEVLDEGLKPR